MFKFKKLYDKNNLKFYLKKWLLALRFQASRFFLKGKILNRYEMLSCYSEAN